HDLRCVYYGLSPRPLSQGVYAKQVVEHVKSLEASGWRAACPFGGFNVSGQETDPDKQVKFMLHSMDYRNTEQWGDLLRATENEFEIMGLTPDLWRGVRNFRDLVMQKAAAGCKIRVLIMHEDNP